MIVIPQFIRACVKKAKCPHCDSRFAPRAVHGLGLRSWKADLVPCVEFKCQSCGSDSVLAITDRPTTIQQFGRILYRTMQPPADRAALGRKMAAHAAMQQHPGDRSPQAINQINILDCVPGNLGSVDGDPITLINYECEGEIEVPLAITIDDTKRLLPDLLFSLTEAGDEFARILLDRYWPDG